MRVKTDPDKTSTAYVHIRGDRSYLLFWGGKMPAIGARKRRWKDGRWEMILDSGASISARAVYCEGGRGVEIE